MSTESDATGIAAELRDEIDAESPSLLDRHPISAYIESLDEVGRFAPYTQRSSRSIDTCMSILDDVGADLLDRYHRLVLAILLADFRERCSMLNIPPAIEVLELGVANRILGELRKPKKAFYHFGNDQFVKDLAVCRLKLLVCGPELVDISAGIPRRWLLDGSPVEICQRLHFVATKLGGFKPVYETHLDRRLIAEFSPRGYELCYQRIGDLVRLNRHIRGVMLGGTWFFDPFLDDISPELGFLRDVPTRHGALLVPTPVTSSTIADATRLSPRRMQLFKNGTYRPRSYMLIWAREDLLNFRPS